MLVNQKVRILIFISFLFLRNQIKPITQLAMAAEEFGKGNNVSNFKVSGASDVRRAAIEFLKMKNLDLKKISQIYVNSGPGSFAGIRNSLTIVKAFHLINKTDYYCFSFDDLGKKANVKYENIPKLCEKLKVEKNLINPIFFASGG